MKILHISDTHGCHRRLHNLPQADIVVHSGDFTMNGSEQEALGFMNWFCDLPCPQKIFICGNHDDSLCGATIDGLDSNIHYGSEELLSRITTVQPRLHLFGHIHSQHGTIVLNGTTFSNGAIMNADYSNFRMPNLVEL